MKKFLIILILIGFILSFPGTAICFYKGKINYDLMYEDMPILDFMYENRLDPEESGDYQEYFVSPYVLVRLPMKLRNKKNLLLPGYYLVKPEKKDGYSFMIFKQNGRVVGLIPVYKKYRVNPLEIFPEPPKPEHKWYTWPFCATWNVVKWPFSKIFKRRKPPVPPRAKVEFELVGDDRYYDMGLYVEDSLYKMLFKLEK